MRKRYTVKGLALIFALLIVNQGWAQITAQEAIKLMERGINLGNTFDAPNYEGEWAPAAKEYYFEMYAQAGFKTVRVPITWNKRIGTEDPFVIDPIFLSRIDTVISWCLKYDLFVIINVHHDGWIKNTETFDEKKPRFYALWSQLSEHYKDYSEKLMFEIINEPHYEEGAVSKSLEQAQLDELNQKALEIIRTLNPTRIVIYGGKQWSSSSDLFNAAIPDSLDSYLMGYYHSYDPWAFAGEGNGTWGSSSDVNAMESQMINVKNWSEENNVPVLIGEFGAQKRCEYNSRMFYYANYMELALKHNLAPCVWDDGGDFQVLLRNESKWNDIKDILIYSSDSSTTALKTEMVDDTVVQLSWELRSVSPHTVQIEKRTLTTEFSVIAEFGSVSSTTHLDYDAAIGENSFYRVVSVFSDRTIPSYPISIFRKATERAPFLGHPTAIPGTLEAEDFDKGGELVSYHDTEPENRGGAYRLTEGVDIEARPEGGFQVGYVAEGEWMEYTVDVAKTTTYKFTAFVASTLTGGQFQLEFPGELSEIITTPNTGSWTTLDNVSGTVDLEAGEQIMRFTIKSANAFNIDKIVFEEYTSIIEKDNKVMKLYPNPANDILELTVNNQDIHSINIYNSNGALIKTQEIGASRAVINVSTMPNGIYFIIAKTNSGLGKTSFVKQ